MVLHNYAKQSCGLFTRITGKIAAKTFMQYVNFMNHRTIGQKNMRFLIQLTGIFYKFACINKQSYMIPILEYVAQVHKRAQKIDFINRTPHMDLVEDFMYDMKSNNLVFHSDEEVVDYLDSAISDSHVRQAFYDFKRNYKAWLRRHK